MQQIHVHAVFYLMFNYEKITNCKNFRIMFRGKFISTIDLIYFFLLSLSGSFKVYFLFLFFSNLFILFFINIVALSIFQINRQNI